MKKSTKIIAVSLLTIGVTSGVFAYGANSWKMSPEKKAEHITDMITENLELNSFQQENLTALSETVLEMMNEVHSSRSEQLELVQQILSEPTMDQTAALQMIQQKTQMINDNAPTVIASVAGFLDSLDSEQKQELREHVSERMSRRHKDH